MHENWGTYVKDLEPLVPARKARGRETISNFQAVIDVVSRPLASLSGTGRPKELMQC